MTYEQHHVLISGLVETKEQIRLYQTSPTFKAQIEMLARLLPSWVDGLASTAAETDRRHNEAVEAMKLMPSAPLIYTADQLQSMGIITPRSGR